MNHTQELLAALKALLEVSEIDERDLAPAELAAFATQREYAIIYARAVINMVQS